MLSLLRRVQDLQVQQFPGVKVFGQIRLLSEELEITEKTLSKQLQLVLDYTQLTDERIPVQEQDDPYRRHCRGNEFISYSGNLRKRVLDRTVNSLIQKLDDIRELKDRAAYMQFSV